MAAIAVGIVAAGAPWPCRSAAGFFSIRSAPTKGMYRHMAAHPGARVALTGWNAYSRIDAVTGYPDSLARLYIDSDAWTGLHRWDGDVKSVEHFRTWFRARPFSFTPEREDARDRAGRRLGRAGRAGLGQPRR